MTKTTPEPLDHTSTFESAYGPQEPRVSAAAARSWAAAEESVAAEATPDERLRHAVRTAGLAPSVFNAQPWAFRSRGGAQWREHCPQTP